MNNKRVGFIGLGKIGFPIALNIGKAGFDLTAYDALPRPEYVKQLREIGGRVVTSIKEVANHCDVLITVLPNSTIVEDVLLSEELVSVIKPEMICVDISSGFPDDTKRIARVLESHGVHMVDAPICNGGVPGAYLRDIKLCVGGDQEIFESVEPILSAAAKEVKHVGELGMGHSIKAISNYLIFASTSVISEALALGTACKFDSSYLINELKTCAASKFLNLNMAQMILSDSKSEANFRADLAAKDLRYASQLASNRGILSIMGNAAHELYQISVQNGYGSEEAIRAPYSMLQKLEKSTV
ncbi:NAD(P)-dependent oxidoreductase [Bacillus sp. JJ722]|uniref:NAD(P)-dependent oxidoreductase n=1 Tax=Bacillus sp. JJ722 TaxID=3122973 RepID=UPI003000919E